MKSLKLALAGLLAGLTFSIGAHAQNISIATGGTGGVYYPMGGGIAACCPSTCRACRPPPKSPAARSTTSS